MNYIESHFPSFKESPQDQVRFFSAGHLDSLLSHLNLDRTVNFGTLWVRANGYANETNKLESSIEYVFWKEMYERKAGKEFSDKIVITGCIDRNLVKETGGMGDEVEFVKGSVPVDKVFLVTGTFENPILEDITEELFNNLT